jgi:DNA-binding MarR family transcriptional regulator
MRNVRELHVAPEPPALGAGLDFLRLLWAIDHALNSRSKRMAEARGITEPQRLVLRIVGRFPGIPPGDLARLLHLHPSTMTGILQRLEDRGWIARRQDPRDRRRVLIGLTRGGRLLDLKSPDDVEADVERVLAGASPREIAALRRILAQLAEELGSHDEL